MAQTEKAPDAANHAAARGDRVAVVDGKDWIVPARQSTLTGVGETHGCDVGTDHRIPFDAGAGAPVGTVLAVGPARGRSAPRRTAGPRDQSDPRAIAGPAAASSH